MKRIVFTPPYGEELQKEVITVDDKEVIFVSSAVNVLLNLEKKALASSQVERINAALREIPTSEEEVDMTQAPSRYNDTLADKLASAKSELSRLKEAELSEEHEKKLEEQKKKLQSLKEKYGFDF